MLIYANGEWVPPAEAVVPFYDQGFLYGESLFETIRINQGQAFRIDKHLERMASGIATIRMDWSDLLTSIPSILDSYIQKNSLISSLVRVMITGGVKQPHGEGQPTGPALYMTSRSLPAIPDWPVPVIFLQEKDYPLLRFHPAIKSGNYLGNMLAKKDADAQGAFEPVFVNNDGLITECAIRNIFFIKEDVLHTPAIELGVLPGVIRDTIMELARKRGLEVQESFIPFSEVNQMDEAFISSTGVGVLPVTWEGFHSDYTLSKRLQADLQNLFDTGESYVS